MAQRIASSALRRQIRPCSRCSAYRLFSTSAAQRKDQSAILANSQRPEESIASQTKKALAEAYKSGNIPSDFGILPGSFITPASSKRPSLTSAPRARLRLEYQRLKQHGQDFLQLVAYCMLQKPRLRLLIRQKAPTALVLYRRMYTAFAEGDVDTLGEICADGLREKLKARLKARGKERVIWEFHENEKPRVVSSRAADLGDGFGLRQAVVRVRSRQSLIRYRADGTRYFQTGDEKDVEEYVVIQKQKFHSEEGPWMLWGTIEPTPPDT